MPRNGSGVYSAPAGTKGVTQLAIESAKYNAFVDDLVAEANNARPITAGGTGASTAAGARTALSVPSVEEMKVYVSGIPTVDVETTTIPSSVTSFRTNGYHAAGDGGAALWVEAEEQADGAGRRQDAAGRWFELGERMFANPYMLGAVGDGDADDVDVLDEILAWAAGKAVVWITAGTFAEIAGYATVPSNSKVAGAGGIIWQKTVPATNPLVAIDPGNGEFSGLHINRESENIEIAGVKVRGPYWPAETVHRTVIAEAGTGYSDSFAVTGTNGVTGTATASGGAIQSITITNHGSDHNGDRIDFDLSAGGGSDGRAYGVLQDTRYRSYGIAISGRWDETVYEELPPTAAPSRNIKIYNCDIEGFGAAGIWADHIHGFDVIGNRIFRCGANGVRTYGVVGFNISDNDIEQIAPGFLNTGVAPNHSVYGITATRIYDSTAEDGTLTDFPRSEDGIIANNRVRKCWGWKSIDTHGGKNIAFLGNLCEDSHNGIGIDKGGYTAEEGYAPPIDIKVDGNTFRITPDMPITPRIGIFATAHDDTDENMGRGLMIGQNTVDGYGRDGAEGAVYVQNQRGASVVGTIIKNSLRAGLVMRGKIDGIVVSAITIDGVTKSSAGICRGISVEDATVRGSFGPCNFKQELADTMVAINTVTPAAGYGLTVAAEQTKEGNVTLIGSPGHVTGGAVLMLRGFANVNNVAGAVSISAGSGLSAAYVSDGVVDITMANPAGATNTMVPMAIVKNNNPDGYEITAIAQSASVYRVVTERAGVKVNVGFYTQVCGY